MKIWFETLTGKQALLFHYMGQLFENEGHETIFTAREYDYVLSNLNRLQRTDYHAIGKYGGASLLDKLVAGSERIIQLAKLMNQEKPDLLITLASPDATRTAFGLGIPALQVNDTPHAEATARLTLSISNGLVHPAAIEYKLFEKLGGRHFFPYQGVDEVLWTKAFKPKQEILEQLQLNKYEYIVIRCEESKAAYFQQMYPQIKPGSTIVIDMIEKLHKEGIDKKIIAFPRYPEQQHELTKFKDDVIIPDKSLDTLTLLQYANVAMTGGGTMGREGALLGTPTLYTFPRELEVSTYISQLGFPLFHVPNHLDAIPEIIHLVSSNRMNESVRQEKLLKLETPYDGVIRAMNALNLNKEYYSDSVNS